MCVYVIVQLHVKEKSGARRRKWAFEKDGERGRRKWRAGILKAEMRRAVLERHGAERTALRCMICLICGPSKGKG